MLKYNNNNMYNKMNNIYRYKKKEPHERTKTTEKKRSTGWGRLILEFLSLLY